jgi:RNase H-fold protein (predicted Holliday junction resolvase)
LAHIIAERQVHLAFIRDLAFVIPPECKTIKINEDYSSVQAGAKLGNYKKTAAEDSMAAVYIMQEYKNSLV